MLFSEVKRKMQDFNSKHNIERKVCHKYNDNGELIQMIAKVIVSNNYLKREYPIEQRTYTFNNYNKALTSSDLGYSIFAYCEYDEDIMRLELMTNDNFENCEIIEVIE